MKILLFSMAAIRTKIAIWQKDTVKIVVLDVHKCNISMNNDWWCCFFFFSFKNKWQKLINYAKIYVASVISWNQILQEIWHWESSLKGNENQTAVFWHETGIIWSNRKFPWSIHSWWCHCRWMTRNFTFPVAIKFSVNTKFKLVSFRHF